MNIPQDNATNWPPEFLGPSQAIAQTRKGIQAAAATRARLLIAGGPGSGKSLAARMVHYLSPRWREPCARLACTDPALIERSPAQLEAACEDALARAKGGTLVIDDVDLMPEAGLGWLAKMAAQGADTAANVHTIALTRVNLLDAVDANHFPADLHDRLAVSSLTVPNLDSRPEDIPDIARGMAARFARRAKAPPPLLDGDALAWLQIRPWPGGLEEMRGFVEWMATAAWAHSGKRATQAIPPRERANPTNIMADFAAMTLRDAREDFERRYLRAQLDRFGGNKTETAKFVGMARQALHQKLRDLGLEPTEKVK